VRTIHLRVLSELWRSWYGVTQSEHFGSATLVRREATCSDRQKALEGTFILALTQVNQWA
jgi:hypothetical protein